ncbi:xanthine dehydrogenase molybdopterin binding subunit [Litorivicinus lipolyticus]|uniref:xanthine dehydrogenase molybdopterin binding subunit n=1 Tax=Litorivicinus lipolyticus TaxID=418701 RepID=UPI003B5A279D
MSHHDSGELHVAGTATYLDDIAVPANTLHCAPVLSRHAHAGLGAIDLDALRACPGVVEVLTAADIPGKNDVSPIAGDDPLFADGEVIYEGQQIAAVVATSRLAALEAARSAVVDYQPRPAVISLADAIAANQLIQAPYRMSAGDAESAIAQAAHALDGSFELGGQDHFYLEGQAALALPGEQGAIEVVSSTQHPTEVQHVVARVLGVADHLIDVAVRRLGGGFGGKETQGNYPAAVAALAAQRLGVPVKYVMDRDDDMRMTGKRHDFRIDYRVGFDDRGRILGLAMTHHVRCGNSMDLSSAIADRAMFHADNAYHIENLCVDSLRYRTHTVSATAFRGFGGPQGMVGMERVIDQVAHHLQIDPLAVRLCNAYRDGPTPGQRTHYGMNVNDGVIQALMQQLATDSDYVQRRAAINRHNETGPMIRRGIALTPVKFGISFTTTHLNQAGALVHIYSDGSIQVNHGGIEMGQGLYTKIRQIAADALAIDPARIRLTRTQTDKVPNTSATAASSGADMNGMAVANACHTLRRRLTDFIAATDGCQADQVEWAGDRICTPAGERGFADWVQAAYLGRISLSATGFYATPDIHWDRDKADGRPFYYFAYGAAVTEAWVDTLTGESRLVRADLLHDVGRSLNPAIDLGQIEGGYVQGAGWLTCEELVWTESGRLATHAPSTYKVPCASDRPLRMNASIYGPGCNRELTIKRSKAVGEPPLMLGISAWLALSHALEGSGRDYPGLDAPATPERLLNCWLR